MKQDKLHPDVDFPTLYLELELWIFANRYAVLCDIRKNIGELLPTQCTKDTYIDQEYTQGCEALRKATRYCLEQEMCSVVTYMGHIGCFMLLSLHCVLFK